MAKKIKRVERYFELQQKIEALMPGHRTMWQIEEERFDLTCYHYGGNIRAIVQNFYDGGGIFPFLMVQGNKFDDVALAIAQNLVDAKGKFLITFTTEGGGDKIDTSQTRCVMLEGAKNPFYQCWRGDNIGGSLQKLLNELKAKYNAESWYDLHTIYENKATKSNLPVRYKTETEPVPANQ